MADLRDFLQSMSNSAASNVSAPVDGINWLLGKAGLPVSSAPFMGSDWMAQKGLTRPVQQGAASILGETAGMVAPMAIAAKAPQIARGLLQAGENAMIPRTLNPQTGAIVWHGSPHKFDKFDSGKIGTGEGAQAYGHGLYLAEAPAVAKEYATKLSSAGLARNTLAQSGGDIDGAIAAASRSVDNYRALLANGGGGDPQRAKSMLNLAEKKLGDLHAMKGGTLDEAGSLYKVDLPDEHIAKMLDWDKPLSQQHPDVQKALASTKNKQLQAVVDYATSPYTTPGLEGEVKTMGEAIKLLGMNASPAKGSAMLAKQGIPGIRYLDGGSRGTGAGTSNFVVFPGNEDILKIMERNGKGLLAD